MMGGILAALTQVAMVSFALGLSRVKAWPELGLALDSPAGSGWTGGS